jgi:hypothetical protein
MAVSVEPGLLSGWRGEGTVWLQVLSSQDPDRLLSALTVVRTEIGGLAAGSGNGPKYVSDAMAIPGGYVLMVDFGSTPAELVHSVPDRVARRLVEAGVHEAQLAGPPRMGDRYATVTGFAPVARAWLRGPLGVPLGAAPRTVPSRLLELATEWVRQGRPEWDPIGLVVSVELPLTWPSVIPVLTAALATHAPVTVLATDFASAARAGAVSGRFFNTVPQAALTAGGAGWTRAAVAAALESQRDLIRAHAEDVVWAGATGVPDGRDTTLVGWDDRDAPGSGRPDPDRVPDLLVPDGMWYQVLSAGHVARLGGPPPGSYPLAGDRYELTVGTAEQWVPGHPDRPAVQARARELLAGCLADRSVEQALVNERMARARAEDTSGFFPRR